MVAKRDTTDACLAETVQLSRIKRMVDGGVIQAEDGEHVPVDE